MALTDKQTLFAEGVARGMTAADAAKNAGYANNSANSLKVQASRLMKDPEIQRAVWELRERRLQGSLASKAIATLEAVMDDLSAPAPARIQAAKFVLEAAGHGIESRRLAAKITDPDSRRLSDYSLAELEAFIADAESRMKTARGGVIEIEGGEPEESSE